MHKFHKTMSQAVLSRIKKRRRERISLLLLVLVIVAIFTAQGYIAHLRYKQIAITSEQLANMRELLKFNSLHSVNLTPDWADFQIGGNTHETYTFLSSDGVPQEVMINGERWDIIHVDQFNDAKKYKPNTRFGGTEAETYCDKKTIAYITDEDKTELRVSLMHEIFHAGDCAHGGDTWWNSIHPTNSYHPGVYHLGQFMATFLRENPQFAMWEGE